MGKVISSVREEKPQTVIAYNHHMRYMDKGDRMAISYSIAHSSG
jgi:hypothetical protein